MSYWCNATNETVANEMRVLVPVKIRKVIYIAQTRPDPRTDFLQFVSQSEGWEIVEELPVRQSAAEWFKISHPPEIVGEKEVRFLIPRKAKEKGPRVTEDLENEKPEND